MSAVPLPALVLGGVSEAPSRVAFIFSANAGSTPNRFNFFQTVGNHVKLPLTSFNNNLLYFSNMRGEEIHGEIIGFRNKSFNGSVTRRDPLDDNLAHQDCGDAGTDAARQLIAIDILSGK